MNRVLRLGLMMPIMLLMTGAAAWVATGGGGYGGTPDYYPVTVRMWLNDSFVGGIEPAVPSITEETTVLSMLAAGNDLIRVGADAPRCPVMTVAWVSPDPGTPAGAQVYSATIRCAQQPVPEPDAEPAAVPANHTYDDLGSLTFRDIQRAMGEP